VSKQGICITFRVYHSDFFALMVIDSYIALWNAATSTNYTDAQLLEVGERIYDIE